MNITFGKYRGKSISDIIKIDNQYSHWIITQPWFSIKHSELYNYFLEELNKEEKEVININECFIIYTDGACRNNGSSNARAGIGVHYSSKNKIKLIDVSEKLICDKPTNNKAELTAILRALKECFINKIKQKIIIYTDSDYCIKCITVWYPEWIKGSTKNRKNIDILNEIYKIYQYLDIRFIHIRSHTGLMDEHSIGNSIADNLATSCIV